MKETVPYRLKNRNAQPVGIHSTLSPKGMFFFGVPFFGFGLYFTLGSLGLVELDESKVNGPMWLLTAAGLVFLIGGLMIWGLGWQQARLLSTVKKLARIYPNDPCMADYPWDREGYSPPRWTPVRKSVSALLFIIIFASIPNYLAYESDPTPLVLRLATIVMNLIVIAVCVYTLRTIWHAIKFGHTRLLYPHFPIRLGETVDLEIQLPPRLRPSEGAALHLRCLKEFYETTGTGKNRNKRLVHEVIYEANQSLDAGQLANQPGSVRAQFAIPRDAVPSRIQGEPPHFWELELKLEVPGLDLNQRYLLPVYSP